MTPTLYIFREGNGRTTGGQLFVEGKPIAGCTGCEDGNAVIDWAQEWDFPRLTINRVQSLSDVPGFGEKDGWIDHQPGP
jgi:hypothetical protein